MCADGGEVTKSQFYCACPMSVMGGLCHKQAKKSSSASQDGSALNNPPATMSSSSSLSSIEEDDLETAAIVAIVLIVVFAVGMGVRFFYLGRRQRHNTVTKEDDGPTNAQDNNTDDKDDADRVEDDLPSVA